MSPFLTVREAATLTGKSPSSIRRILYPIIKDDAHPDRSHIRPGVEEAVQHRVKGENFAWRVGEEFLRRAFPVEAAGGRVPHSDRDGVRDGGELIEMLRRELEIKNQQIAQHGELIGKQMELISGLSERLREGNILIGSLQQRLTLPKGKEGESSTVDAVSNSEAATRGKGSRPKPKAAKPKGGFLARWFQ